MKRKSINKTISDIRKTPPPKTGILGSTLVSIKLAVKIIIPKIP
jgi:hypothetical protein